MRNKSTFTSATILFVLLISLIPVSNSFAQENGIYEISSANNSKNKNDNGKDKSRARFYDLALNLQPTHYIENKRLKSVYDSGDPIKMTFEDSKSLDWLNNKDSKKDSIELLIFYINDINELKNLLDISNDRDLKNLKYVFIRCKFNCSVNDIKRFIKTDSKVRIFYTNEIGG